MASATDDLAFWFVHTATVAPYLGSSRYGADSYGSVRDLPCFKVDDTIVTTQADGTEVTTNGMRVYFPLAHAAELPVGTKVTFDGWPAPSRVAQRRVNDPGTLDLPGHVKVVLT